jgi:hypothetical protein
MLSKKQKDCLDWAICVEVYFTGRHTLQKGKDLILLLRSRMNNNRLSTNLINQKDLLISQANIEAVFKLPAPYEVRGGARYISGTNKLVPEPFPIYVKFPDGLVTTYPSLSQCASALGISRRPVKKNLDTGTPYNGFFFFTLVLSQGQGFFSRVQFLSETLPFYDSSFLLGLSGHVLIGTIFLSVGLYRIINYHLTKHHHVGFEGAILYWHMVDVVWLFLFIFF